MTVFYFLYLWMKFSFQLGALSWTSKQWVSAELPSPSHCEHLEYSSAEPFICRGGAHGSRVGPMVHKHGGGRERGEGEEGGGGGWERCWDLASGRQPT